MILVYRILKGMQDRVEAYFLADGLKSLLFKIMNQQCFIMTVKGIYDLISITYKAVNAINGVSETFMKRLNTATERCTVLLGYQFTALKTGFIIQVHIYARHQV